MIGFAPETAGPVLHDVPAFHPAEAAVFLDFDGVLVELAETPDAIQVPGKLGQLLNALVQATDGATAVVSGRAVADLRKYLPDFSGTLIGCHGAEIDQGAGVEQTVSVDAQAVEHLVALVEAFANCDAAYLAERKPSGAVLHFRRNPDLRGNAYHFLETILHDIPGFHIHHSKMAFEIRPDGVSKDAAVEQVLSQEPFANRRPVYIGDDVTDEPALLHCKGLDGISIKVGEGPTEAAYRLDETRDVLAYLAWSLTETETGSDTS
jgi:trehalose 6-phosphate phosphatase